MSLSPDQIPVIPRGVRLHFDKVRQFWVLLAPERAISLDPIGQAILEQIDGTRSFGAITTALCQKYDAPEDQIAGDCARFVSGLVNRRILELRT